MKRALYIQRGVLAKEHTGWIDEPEIGTLDFRAQWTIDKRLAASCDPTDDIVDGRRSPKGRTLAGIDVKEAKAMKEIGAHRLAHGIGDHKVGAGERTRWA